jgi:hypothetical protein
MIKSILKKRWGCGCFTFGVGNLIAFILSFMTSKSILLGLFHGILSWIYVIYWVIVYKIF